MAACLRGSGLTTGLLAALALAAPAGATPPGQNGPIVWQSYTGATAYELWIMDADGSNKDEITDSPQHDERAQISPDLSRITFMYFEEEPDVTDSVDIWRMNADGSSRVALTNNDDNEYEPTWSPDGNTIVFTRQSSGMPSGETAGQDLWAMPASGGTATNITNTPNSYECCPEFSPDGSKIVFTNSGDDDNNAGTPQVTQNEIYVVNANGSGLTRLTDNAAQDVGPTWSPDGSKIAWVNVDNGTIWTMNSDGSDEDALTGSGSYYAPSWSPDGTRIATQCGNGYDICSLSVASPLTDVVNLTQSAIQDEYPNWGPIPDGPGEEPNTKITKKPDAVLKRRKATYRFTTDPVLVGATFECKLDSAPYFSCTSPQKFDGLSNGKHKVKIVATAGGVPDPTPAKHSFRVKP